MEAYSDFAKNYDLFMREIPYDAWCAYLSELLSAEGVRDGLVLELGCGTGNMTERLARKGYDMTGIDLSAEMLNEALIKREESGLPILYLQQDIRAFELYGTMAAVVSVCDTMNYLTEPEDFIETLRLVNNYLDPGGVFIFDLKTEFFYEHCLGNAAFGDAGDEAAYIWDNDYDPETKINDYLLTLFEQQPDGRYVRSEEEHVQRAYSLDEIRLFAKKSGLRFLKAYDAFTHEPPREDSERIYVILKEQGK